MTTANTPTNSFPRALSEALAAARLSDKAPLDDSLRDAAILLLLGCIEVGTWEEVGADTLARTEVRLQGLLFGDMTAPNASGISFRKDVDQSEWSQCANCGDPIMATDTTCSVCGEV